jgi:hypothetical protein
MQTIMVSNQEAMQFVQSLILKLAFKTIVELIQLTFAHPNSFNKITNVNIFLGNTYQRVNQFKKGQDAMEASN